MAAANGEQGRSAKYPDLAGKRVLVTGASQGIGRAIALAFAAQGATVAIASRTKSKLDAVVAEMGSGHTIVADMADTEACERAVKEAVAALGGLDVIVNNAPPATDLMYSDPDSAAAALDAFNMHVASAVAITQAALPQLKANKGVVVNVSSGGSVVPLPTLPCYTMAKGGLDALTRVYALKYAKDGIRVNALRVGCTTTGGFTTFGERNGLSEEAVKAHGASSAALGRMCHPDEQASAALFLASTASSFITGDTMDTTGGATLGFWFNASYRSAAAT